MPSWLPLPFCSQYPHFGPLPYTWAFMKSHSTFPFASNFSPHEPILYIHVSCHFPTNKSSGTFRVKSNFSVWWWKPPSLHPVPWVALPISHLISNTSLPELGLLLALASCLPSAGHPSFSSPVFHGPHAAPSHEDSIPSEFFFIFLQLCGWTTYLYIIKKCSGFELHLVSTFCPSNTE